MLRLLISERVMRDRISRVVRGGGGAVATRDRAPSARECCQWRTCTDNDYKKRIEEERKKRKAKRRGEERHDSLAATQPGEWLQEEWHGISV